MTSASLDAPVAPTRSIASVLVRVAALLAGALILLGAAAISLGAALLAPLGMWALSAYRRRHNAAATRAATWLAAMAWAAVGLLGFMLFTFGSLPAGSMQQMKRTVDSASVANAKAPPPAWMERIAPGTNARAAQRSQLTPVRLGTPLLIWSAVMGFLFMGALGGSFGWVGAMLCGFAIAGRWPYGPVHGPLTG